MEAGKVMMVPWKLELGNFLVLACTTTMVLPLPSLVVRQMLVLTREKLKICPLNSNLQVFYPKEFVVGTVTGVGWTGYSQQELVWMW